MNKNRDAAATSSGKLENFLAWGAILCIGASVLSFLIVLVIAAVQSTREAPGGAYQALAWIAYVGLPVGFLMLFTLLFLNLSRRKKQQRR